MTNRLVVSTREENLYDDSYFYATFWNEGQTGLAEFTEEMIGATAFAGGCYNADITAPDDVRQRWRDSWLSLKSKFDRQHIICAGNLVYAPNARKYKSLGEVKSITKDQYDSREFVALVAFAEGNAWMRVNKLVKLQPFIQSW
jgi:hypothetical protein